MFCKAWEWAILDRCGRPVCEVNKAMNLGDDFRARVSRTSERGVQGVGISQNSTPWKLRKQLSRVSAR